MKLVFITCGLPGKGYHGGAVTCWSIVSAMRKAGHETTVLSLFDISDYNPYLESRAAQQEELEKIGVKVEYVDHDYRKWKKDGWPAETKMERYFQWKKLRREANGIIEKIGPDAMFCYHFDALSAVYETKAAPLMAGVGDLWHQPSYFRWKLKKPSFRKYTTEALNIFRERLALKGLMLEMLGNCVKKGAFAAHYARWLRGQNGLSNSLYLRTPVPDIAGPAWESLKRKNEPDTHRAMVIGDLATTSTYTGLSYIINDVLPRLEREFDANGFEIHFIGGGRPPADLSEGFKRPAVRLRGRVTPADQEFLRSNVLIVPTPITLGIRVRIITAFSFGLCVVAHSANSFGIPELRHDENCLLADSGPELADQVVRCLIDKSLRDRLGKAGRETFEKYFSEDVAAGRVVSEIETMAQS